MILTEGLKMEEGKEIGLIISIPTGNVYDYRAEPLTIEIYGKAEFGGEIEEKGVGDLHDRDKEVLEMEARGYKLAVGASVIFPSSHTHGFWHPPYIVEIDRRLYPWVWLKDGKVWVDTEGLTC